MLGADRAKLRHGDLKVRQQLQKECLEPWSARSISSMSSTGDLSCEASIVEQRPSLQEKLLAEEISSRLLPIDVACRFDGLQVQHLARVIPLVDC